MCSGQEDEIQKGSVRVHYGVCWSKLQGFQMAVNVKLSNELVAKAKRFAAIGHRSLPKQIEYWSRMGKIAEENPDLPFSVIKDILIAREENTSEEYVFD